MQNHPHIRILLASAALAALAAPGWASAQNAAPPAAGSSALEEVVVTATRQTDTVSRVALSITAVTQKSLDEEGVKNIQDLARTVPELNFRRTGGEANPAINIRGISSNVGASTTGVYLDDTPLQKRGGSGVTTGNGTPFPQMFDLERVEVLRGPQGTLFGGSSEGGTVRFISPAPSLTKFSGTGRAEVNSVDGGGIGYEGGIAVGGPIIPDKLGMRISIWDRHSAGYIDHVSIYDSSPISSNTNYGDSKAGRIALTWAPTDRLKITPSIYLSSDYAADRDTFWEKVPQFTVNSGYFTNKGTVNGIAYNFPDTFFPGGTYGPYNQFGPFKNPYAFYAIGPGAPNSPPVGINSPRTSILTVPSLTIDYDFSAFSFKSISSYVDDDTHGYTNDEFTQRTQFLPTTTNAGFVTAASHTGQDVGTPVTNGLGASPLIIPGYAGTLQYFSYINWRHAFSQEFRFSSKPDSGPLSWVAGAFYSTSETYLKNDQFSNENQVVQTIRGLSQAYLFGEDVVGSDINADRETDFKESELAGFGEVNYNVTSKLKLTAGVRVSQNKLAFLQTQAGPVYGPPPAFQATPAAQGGPTTANPFPVPGAYPIYTTFTGNVNGTPVTPKFGISYQITDKDMVYATMSQGYRPGGVNPSPGLLQCATDLAALGVSTTPLTYNSDSVTNYETGAKLRLFDNRMSLNSSLFYIDWKNPQLTTQLRQCNFQYVVNAGHAVSKGGDIQGQAKLLGHLTINGAVSYDDARYTEAVLGPVPPAGLSRTIIVNKGDELGAPTWQYNFGGQFDWLVADRYNTYVRADYQYASQYKRTVGVGAMGYDPAIYIGSATHFATARAGVFYQMWEAAFYVDNLTNSQDRLYEAHTAAAALITSQTYRPRTIGLQINYRY